MSLKTVKQWVHKRIKPIYTFKPKAGTEKPRYRCPFCGRMTHAERFQTLEIPNLDMDIMFYGGYRGIKVVKHAPSAELRLGILEAVKEKLKWLYEKIGGEEEWLKSKSVSILAAPSTSSWTTAGVSRLLSVSAHPRLGVLRSTPSGTISSDKPVRRSK